MNRTSSFVPGEIYHLFNRGVDKQKIFRLTQDYQRFQRLLYVRNSDKQIDLDRVKNKTLAEIDRGEPMVEIVAYALMPNHFHLLVKEITEGGISTFMQRFGTSYSMYFNKLHERSGPLMCRPFRSKLVDSDQYLRYLISYIHLNPRELFVEHNYSNLGDYPYSSFVDYYGARRAESCIVQPTSLPFSIVELESESVMEQIVTDSTDNMC